MVKKRELRQEVTSKVSELIESMSEVEDPYIATHVVGHRYGFHYSNQKMNNVVDFILRETTYGEYFNKEGLKQLIENTINKLVQIDEQNSAVMVKQIVEKIVAKPKKYFCRIPVSGITLKKPIELGFVTIYPNSYEQEVLKQHVSDECLEKLSADINVKKNELNFVTLTVPASVSKGAIEIASKVVQTLINSLQVIFGNPSFGVYDIRIGKSNVSMDDKELLAYCSNDEWIQEYPYPFTPFKADLNILLEAENKEKKDYVIQVMNIQEKILKHDRRNKLTKLEKGFYNANNLISEGFTSTELSTKIVKYMSAIEALVEEKDFNRSVTDQVCERVTMLIAKDDLDSRKNIYKKMVELYSMRSDLSHGEITNAIEADATELWYISTVLIVSIMTHFNEFNEREGL